MGVASRQKYYLDHFENGQQYHTSNQQRHLPTPEPSSTSEVRQGMSCTNFLFVSGSMTLTTALILVGICFFAPFWLSNIPAADERDWTDPMNSSYLPGDVEMYPDRGLWAQCGVECHWFWEDGFQLQTRLLTPLKWHLATQVLYFIGAVLLLIAEIFARGQLCCDERTAVYWALAVIVLASGLIQLGALATFGAGASQAPYKAVANPIHTTPLLGKMYDPDSDVGVYLGWGFWAGVVGDMLTIVAGTLFAITAICVQRKM